jgi:hypothetical protein
MGSAVVESGGPFGRDIDVEGSVILDDTLPDTFNGGLFAITVARVIRIGAEGQREEDRPAFRAVPSRSAYVFAGKI